MRIGRAVGWAIKKAATVVERRESAAFAGNESIASETLRERAIEANERALRVIAAQSVHGVARGVERPDLLVAGPERVPAATGAEHAHEQASVFLLVFGNPGFFGGAGRKDAAGENVINDDVPVAADATVGDRVMGGFVGVKRYGNERRRCLAANAAVDGGQYGFSELGSIGCIMMSLSAKVS